MTPELWRRVDRVLAEALALEPSARRGHVARASGGDADVEREVLELLDADHDAAHFLGDPRDMMNGLVDEPEAASDLDGQRMGPYRVVRQLGQGGMGTVYLAERDDDAYRQQVAIKVLTTDQGRAGLRARFRTERQVLANLVHPNIARLLDGGTTDDGRPFLVMEYVEGEPIDVYCDQRRLTIDERLSLFRGVCDAVAFAHRNLVVHRDLKPSNIVVGIDGTPRLLDFGIAKLLDANRLGMTARVTHSGVRPMTPSYASPEQIRGETITTATDVYGLGVLLHGLLSGRGPYRRDRGLESAILDQEPVRPSTAISQRDTAAIGDDSLSSETIATSRRVTVGELRRALRGDLDTIVATALRKRPERRYGSAFALAEDLDRYRKSMPVLARPDSATYRLRKFVRRHTLAVVAGVLAGAVLVGFTIVTRLQSVRLETERDIAQQERTKANDVSRFLFQLFESAAPEQSRGADVSVSDVLARAAGSIAGLERQPAVHGAALATLGRVYTSLGRFDDAIRLLEEAFALQSSTLGEDHLDVATTLAGLAIARLRHGDYEDAEVADRAALTIRQDQLPADDIAIAESLNNLGLVLHHQGRFAEAEPLYRASITITRGQSGHSSPALQDGLGNLAIVLHDLGDYEAAEEAYRASIALRLELLGADHPDMGYGYNNLAVLLHDKGDYDAAEVSYEQAIELRRRVLGPDHPGLYRTISNLARLHHDRGDLTRAQELYDQALARHRDLLGDGHPWVARTVSQLGRLALDQGDLALAATRYEEALALQRARLGDRHKRVAETLIGQGWLLITRGDLDAATAVLTEASAIVDQKLADGHWLRRYAAALLDYCRASPNDLALRGRLGQTREELAERIGSQAPAVRDLGQLIDVVIESAAVG